MNNNKYMPYEEEEELTYDLKLDSYYDVDDDDDDGNNANHTNAAGKQQRKKES